MAVTEPRRTQAGPTHEVLNQVPPLEPLQRLRAGPPARRGARSARARGWAEAQVGAVGEIAGGEALEWGRQANENPPVLRTHDRYGHRIDEVEFHPAWHELMDVAVSHGAALAALDARRGRARTSRAPRCS